MVIYDSPLHVNPSSSLNSVPKVSATSLTFRSLKLAKRFQSTMLDKQIVYGKPVNPLLFQENGIIALFERVEIDKMLFPIQFAYPVLIKQFYENRV